MTLTAGAPPRSAIARSFALGPVAIRLLVLSLLGWQVAQSSAVETSGFIQSYWFVNYSHGFVRRGLGGELFGDHVRLAVIASALVPLAALVTSLELLVRRMTAPAVSMAVLLACSPFVVDELVLHRRPDQFGLAVLIAVGIACVYARRTLAPILAALGVTLAALVFIHEGALLFFGIFAVPMIFATVDRTLSERARLSALVVGPAIAAALAVLTLGAVDAGTTVALANDSGMPGVTVFPFLDDSPLDSVHYLADQGLAAHLTQLTIGGVLVASQVLWIRQWVGTEWLDRFVSLPAIYRAGLAALVAVPVVFTFATGVDWMRWFSVFGTSALVAVSFAILARRDAPQPRVRISLVQIVAAFYLASLSPVPEIGPAVPVPARP